MSRAPGSVRDAVVGYLSTLGRDATLDEIERGVRRSVGKVSPSSVRSYLNLNTPEVFERVRRGRYRLRGGDALPEIELSPTLLCGKAVLYHGDAFLWLGGQSESSLHAIVTDPPYGLVEYTDREQEKLRTGKGGVWRVPPSFDGHARSPLPRFTVLSSSDKLDLHNFFHRFGVLAQRALVPGGNLVVASNPLLQHIVASAFAAAGLEPRGAIVRLVMTMRGGDRPKNAHAEFDGVSVMPRSMWEPWIVMRKPLDGRVQDNLRKWKTGGFRRPSDNKPFGDVISSNPTPAAERRIAPHPSLKPQSFLRAVVKAALPLGDGVIVDPFAGSGSTLAAANAVGYRSIGIERDEDYVAMARVALPQLSRLAVKQVDPIVA